MSSYTSSNLSLFLRPLPIPFFASSRAAEDDLKCSDSEFLSVLPLLEKFAMVVLAPLGGMGDVIKSLRLLRRVMDLLATGASDEILAAATSVHHAAFLTAYSGIVPLGHVIL